MKKSIRIIVFLLMCFLLVSCGKKTQPIPEPAVNVEIEQPAVEVEVAQPTVEVKVEVEEAKPTVEVEVAQPTVEAEAEEPAEDTEVQGPEILKDGVYTSAEDVALYIHTYNCLPQNFMTKKEAKKLGWEGGSLEQVAPGMCIGGDYFGNYEELLPDKKGREYHECDIDTLGKKKRGSKRIIYSNDGLIYYTDDHYKTFTLLYGEE